MFGYVGGCLYLLVVVVGVVICWVWVKDVFGFDIDLIYEVFYDIFDVCIVIGVIVLGIEGFWCSY